MNKEVQRLLRTVERQGCDIRLTSSGHYRVSRGKHTVTVSCTPSSTRGWINTRRNLRFYLGVKV